MAVAILGAPPPISPPAHISWGWDVPCLGARPPKFKSQLLLQLAVWPGARHLAYLGLSFAFCKAEIIIISTWMVVVIKWDPMCTLLNTGMSIQQLVDTIISELVWELGSEWLIFCKKARAREHWEAGVGSLQRKVSGCSHWKLPRFSPPILKVPLLAAPCPKAQPGPSGFCQSHPPVLFHSARWSPPLPPQYWHKKDKILQLFAKGIWQCFSFSLQHSCWTDGKQVSMILFLIWQNHVSSQQSHQGNRLSSIKATNQKCRLPVEVSFTECGNRF